MDTTRSKAELLYQQLIELKTNVEKIQPEQAELPGRHGSGITALIPHYNSLLHQYRETFSEDQEMLKSLNHLQPLEQIQERLSASYHQKAKTAILAGVGSLMACIHTYLHPDKAAESRIFTERGTALERPALVSLSWLWNNVPVKFWGGLAGVVIGAFLLGAYISGFPVVRELLSFIFFRKND